MSTFKDKPNTMKKLLLLFILFNISFTYSQKGVKLYKDLIEGMSVKDAKKMMKKNKEDYNSVSFGNGFTWTIKKTGLMQKSKKSDYLFGVWLWPKGTLLSGLGYDATRNYLDNAGSFFEERGYTKVIKNDWWNAPLNFRDGGYKYGYVLESADKTRVVHIFPTYVATMAGETAPNAFIKLFSREGWDYLMSLDDAKKKKDTKDTDF